MILLAVLLACQCCVSAAAGGSAAGLERIDDCGTGCSQGLRCKTKPQMLFPPPCQNPGEGLSTSSVFHNISVTTVMRCEGRQKCSLNLRISTDLQLTAVQGVSLCAATSGMMANCRTLSFTKASRERMSGMQVKVMHDCFQASPGQRFEIKVKTFPSYCGVAWTGTYVTPGCTTEDVKQHVPDCITGRLSYVVNPERKELAVSVLDMLEGHDYHLRLCHKDFICTGTGAKTLIRKEEPIKKALLQYSRPLPCLCIEGWSAITDARRVQVCPFKDRIEELWFGISANTLEGQLMWEPACPVAAVVSLCQTMEEAGACVDLPHSSRNVSKGKVIFNEVDPHPRLCMKFTTEARSWIRCPFTDASSQEGEVAVSRRHGFVRLLAHINATFSVGLCAKGGGSALCQTLELRTWQAVKHEPLAINMPDELCHACLQVKRADVQFAVTHLYCVDQCNQTPVIIHQAFWELTWIFVPVAVSLCIILLLTLACCVLPNVYHRVKQEINKKMCLDRIQILLNESPLQCKTNI